MSVSLHKRQSVSLVKENKSALTKISVGLGWDPVKPKGVLGFFGRAAGSIDLDASCVMLNDARKKLDIVWFRQLKSKCGSVVHSGDNLTGEGGGDDEIINVDLSKLPTSVEYLAITVNSFRGQTFNEVDNAFCRVVNDKGVELAKYDLSEQGSHTGILIASLARNNGEWTFTANGKACKGRVVEDMISDIVSEL